MTEKYEEINKYIKDTYGIHKGVTQIQQLALQRIMVYQNDKIIELLEKIAGK